MSRVCPSTIPAERDRITIPTIEVNVREGLLILSPQIETEAAV